MIQEVSVDVSIAPKRLNVKSFSLENNVKTKYAGSVFFERDVRSKSSFERFSHPHTCVDSLSASKKVSVAGSFVNATKTSTDCLSFQESCDPVVSLSFTASPGTQLKKGSPHSKVIHIHEGLEDLAVHNRRNIKPHVIQKSAMLSRAECVEGVSYLFFVDDNLIFARATRADC
ncbi:hypothetical protein ACOSQ3_002660 [Xanthoceras sorbifolium]